VHDKQEGWTSLPTPSNCDLRCGITIWGQVNYYAPNAVLEHIEERSIYEATSDKLWQTPDELAADFAVEKPWLLQQRISAVGEMSTVGYEHLSSIFSDDPHWERLKMVISGTNRMDDDGHVQMYASRL